MNICAVSSMLLTTPVLKILSPSVIVAPSMCHVVLAVDADSDDLGFSAARQLER